MGQPGTFKTTVIRVLVAVIVTPQILASGLRADVLLIHDHHGEVTHAHLVDRQNLATFDPHSEHHKGEHYHNGASDIECSENEHGCNIFEIPLSGTYLTKRSRAQIARTLQLDPFTFVTATAPNHASIQCDVPRAAHDKTPLRAHRSLDALLQTSNALLI